ncbi:laccase-14 [Medicago truncatula]|uniref:Laccase n=1 Tax=Medicago truncatula TaxID=3880 RepID=G7ILB5_MEDTR|nr:laccase-14 [Medicago truncatula]AES63403.2 laccase/diphenol oxidase family protein [Medicago truncatula]
MSYDSSQMMVSNKFKTLNFFALSILYVYLIHTANGKVHHHKFVVKSSSFTRLCSTKNILTVNGEFPGPTLKAHRGDTLIVKVYNQADYNITIHWHGARQVRNPWSDGPEYITQCPIKSGNMFKQIIHLTTEEGTIWWHAHNGWARATVHGAVIIYPKHGHTYPFPKPHAEVPIILGEWWKEQVMEIPNVANKTGGEPILSNAYTINGQPGYLYPCSKKDTFKMIVDYGKTYLLRIINGVMDEELFFAIKNHKLTVVGKDGLYLKPIKTDYIMITPGQSMDILMEANQPLGHYFMAARSYSSTFGAGFDNTTTTALLIYTDSHHHHHKKKPILPQLPPYNKTQASTSFTKKFRSLATKTHPINVPTEVDTHLLFTISVNLLNCTQDKPCTGPFGKRFAASVNNISLVHPYIDFLSAYYYKIPGVFEMDFPRIPTREFNYTADKLPEYFLSTSFGTKVLVLDYDASVELVLQGTNVLASDNHPVHLHGYSFYVIGWGFGNFDPKNDPKNYNLIDPPEETTVGVPNNGWVAIRFRADNPGMWLLHCHIERHATWGMSMVFLVKDGPNPQTQMLPPPRDLPKC